jgi:hypothetical protein
MDSKILIYDFCWAQSITSFGLNIFTLIEYNIFYTMVLFQKKNETFEFKILKVWNLASMELELHMAARYQTTTISINHRERKRENDKSWEPLFVINVDSYTHSSLERFYGHRYTTNPPREKDKTTSTKNHRFQDYYGMNVESYLNTKSWIEQISINFIDGRPSQAPIHHRW